MPLTPSSIEWDDEWEDCTDTDAFTGTARTDRDCLWSASIVPILSVAPKHALCDPLLKALVVPGLSDAGDHVQEQSVAQKEAKRSTSDPSKDTSEHLGPILHLNIKVALGDLKMEMTATFRPLPAVRIQIF